MVRSPIRPQRLGLIKNIRLSFREKSVFHAILHALVEAASGTSVVVERVCSVKNGWDYLMSKRLASDMLPRAFHY
jgi:hypothetical protein